MLRHRINPEYLDAALQNAVYEVLPDNEGVYASIPGFEGLWANADTQEACRAELANVLEGWLELSMERDLPVPVVNGVSVTAN